MAISREEAIVAKVFHYGECTMRHGKRGGKTLKQVLCRRNGKTITWITRPEEYRVPVKHGLRTYAHITPINAQEFHTEERCVIRDIFP